jgi:hypothetical protein
MAQQTAVDYLIEQLQAPCRGIPSHIIEQAKQMEKEQIIKAAKVILFASTGPGDTAAEQYYNETYKTK